MIELKLTGETARDAAYELMQFANLVAIGVQVTNAQAAQQVVHQQEQQGDTTTAAPEAANDSKAKGKPGRKSAVKPVDVAVVGTDQPTAEEMENQTDLKDDFLSAEEVVENVEQPKSIDDLRKLVLDVNAKKGVDAGKKIVGKYGAKLSEIPKAKWNDLAADCRKALA